MGMPQSRDHKILGLLHAVLRPFRILWNLLLLAAALSLFGLLQTSYIPDVFLGDQIVFQDPDSYSRMTRARLLLEEGKPVRDHTFENWPAGVTPHTTTPMDALIAAGALGLWTSGWAGDHDAVDLAGALVSPILGGLLIAGVWVWAWALRLPYRVPLLLLLAGSPILVHGFLLGRPDHQSLQLFLVGTGLALELAAWRHPGRWIWIAGGLVWGLALWVSLYEPLVLLLLVWVGRTLRLRAGMMAPPALWWFAGIALPLLLFLLIDGLRIGNPAEQFGPLFQRWAVQIGELSRVSPTGPLLYSWTGWLLPLAPLLLVVTWRREQAGEALLLGLLLTTTIGLTLWQARWGYFLALVFALSLPWVLSGFRKAWVAWPLFVLSLWPLLGSWDTHYFPPVGEQQRTAEDRQEALLLNATAGFLAENGTPDRGVVAPWWLSPALHYRSGLPTVAGSSHQSLPGIADVGRIYLSSDWDEVRRLLRQRNAIYLVAYEPDRIRFTSGSLLDINPPSTDTAADRLYRVYDVPPDFQRIYTNPYFKLYRWEASN